MKIEKPSEKRSMTKLGVAYKPPTCNYSTLGPLKCTWVQVHSFPLPLFKKSQPQAPQMKRHRSKATKAAFLGLTPPLSSSSRASSFPSQGCQQLSAHHMSTRYHLRGNTSEYLDVTAASSARWSWVTSTD